MSGTLFVVATPIGNLEDITLRALRVLREVDADRGRRHAPHGQAARAPRDLDADVSFHEHNTRTRMPQLLGAARAGRTVALVTDAGTPAISDPGVELVQACIDAGIAVDPIPGPVRR